MIWTVPAATGGTGDPAAAAAVGRALPQHAVAVLEDG